MKKTAKVLAMILALGICMSATTCALGEGEEPGAEAMNPEIPESVETEFIEEAPQTDAFSETQVESPVEQPAVQAEPEEKTEVESSTNAEAPAANDGLTEIEDLETPLGLFDSNAGFTGTATIQRLGEGALYYGDLVTLTALVSNVNRLYTIRWEVNCQDEEGWKTIPDVNGFDYSFVLTRENANYEYRVVLVAAA